MLDKLPCSARGKQGQVLPEGSKDLKALRQQSVASSGQECSKPCGRCNHCDFVTRGTAEGSDCCCLPTLMTTAVTDLSLQKYVPVLQCRQLMFSVCTAEAAKNIKAHLTFSHTALRSAASHPETCCPALQVLLLPLKWNRYPLMCGQCSLQHGCMLLI